VTPRPAPVGAQATDDLDALDRAPAPARSTATTRPKAKAPAKKGTVKDEPKAKAAKDKAAKAPRERKEDGDALDPLSKLLPPMSSADLDGDKSDDIERPDDIDGEASVVATSDGGGAGLTGAKAIAALSVLALASAGGFAFWRKRRTELDYWE
jgi:hypothetical protein